MSVSDPSPISLYPLSLVSCRSIHKLISSLLSKKMPCRRDVHEPFHMENMTPQTFLLLPIQLRPFPSSILSKIVHFNPL
jgi:hypothetical protein